jgi:hypothetical protein
MQTRRALCGDPVSLTFSLGAVPDDVPRSLKIEALLPALRAIRTLAESRTTGKLQARCEVRSDTGSPSLVVRDGQLPYDPACVFHLEMMISLAGRGKQHIGETWFVTSYL